MLKYRVIKDFTASCCSRSFKRSEILAYAYTDDKQQSILIDAYGIGHKLDEGSIKTFLEVVDG